MSISHMAIFVYMATQHYIFRICLKGEGFQAIPETIHFRDRQMMVVKAGDNITGTASGRSILQSPEKSTGVASESGDPPNR